MLKKKKFASPLEIIFYEQFREMKQLKALLKLCPTTFLACNSGPTVPLSSGKPVTDVADCIITI
jgi:hypothetical protein